MCHALLKRMNEVIGLDGTVDLQKTNKIQEGDRLNIQKMVDLINVQYIGSVRYYWVDPEVPLGFSLISYEKNHDELFGQRQYIEHCVINSFPFRTIAQFLFLISLELEIHKSEVGPVVAVIRGVLLPSQGC